MLITPTPLFLIEDYIIKLNNYVVQLIRSTSVPARFGFFAIFLLLNDLSHDTHFSTLQNMESEDFLEKKSNFSIHGFSQIFDSKHGSPENYSDFFFCFSSSSSRSRAMRSSCHNFSKILSNRNEISQTCSGVNVVVPNTVWLHSVQGGSDLGDLKVEEFLPCYFRQDFEILRFSYELYFVV